MHVHCENCLEVNAKRQFLRLRLRCSHEYSYLMNQQIFSMSRLKKNFFLCCTKEKELLLLSVMTLYVVQRLMWFLLLKMEKFDMQRSDKHIRNDVFHDCAVAMAAPLAMIVTGNLITELLNIYTARIFWRLCRCGICVGCIYRAKKCSASCNMYTLYNCICTYIQYAWKFCNA